MVALTLGLVLVAGVATLASNSSLTSREVNQASQQQENGRYAMQVIKDDLRHAGFLGEFYRPLTPGGWPNPCATGSGTVDAGLPFAVQGYDNVTSPSDLSLTCIDNADFVPGTDILVVRRADTQILGDTDLNGIIDDPTFADLAFGKFYLQTRSDAYVLARCSDDSNCRGRVLASGSAPPAVSIPTGTAKMAAFSLTDRFGTVARTRRYHVHIYHIRPYSGTDANGNPIDSIPTLVREVLDTNGTSPRMIAEPLIEGIENLQVQYGLDDGSAAGSSPNDGAPDRYESGPGSLDNWMSVVAVRVNLLARNLESSPGYTDEKSYDLGEGAITPGDRFKRHVFSSVVRLINVSARRE
jgi:type IV pilus assembly protein PilW